MNNDILIAPASPDRPYSVGNLPLIAKLGRAAHHRYRRRWTKRLGKKPARIAYKMAHDVFKLSGDVSVQLHTKDGVLETRFNARRQHFGSLYFEHDAAGYEPDVATLLCSLLIGQRRFYDIGANWGYFTFYAAALEAFEGEIHAIEPVPETRADLESLRRGFGLDDRITVHGVALSDEAGTATMAVHEDETGLNRIVGSGVGREGGGRVDVPMVRLDDLQPTPDVIKMDVEDHEYEAFLGAESVLTKVKPFIIFESWLSFGRPVRTMRALRLMEDRGYRLYQPCWTRMTNEGPVIVNNLGGRTPNDENRLALVPFQAEQRFMLSEQLNVFACHGDRLGDLHADGFEVWSPTPACV